MLISARLTSTMQAFWFASLLLATGVVGVGWMDGWGIIAIFPMVFAKGVGGEILAPMAT